MKKFLLSLIGVLTLFWPLKGTAATEEIDGIIYAFYSGRTYGEVIGISKEMSTIVIPSEVTFSHGVTLPVKVIGIGAFAGKDFRYTVKLGDNVTRILDEAFKGSTGLERVIGGERLEDISYEAFEGCTNLKSIELPQVCYLGSLSFSNCSSLETIRIPICPSGWRNQGGSVFYNCTSLREVSFVDGASPGDAMFNNCTSLEKISFSSGTTNINASLCKDCTSLKEVFIPEGVTQISTDAFNGCISLKNINLPHSLEVIETNAFSNTGLSDITIHENIKKIGKSSLSNCDELKSIIIEGNLEQDVTSETFGLSSSNSLEVLKIGGCKNLNGGSFSYSNSSSYFLCFPNLETLEIGTASKISAFSNLPFLKTVKIENCNEMANDSFISCNLLDTVELGYIGAINDGCFAYCISLKDIKIKEGLKTLGQLAFSGCSYLEDVDLPNEVSEIKNMAFLDCQSLKKIVIPKSCKKIGIKTFSGCVSLAEIIFGEDTIELGKECFSGCTSLKNLTIPSNVILGEGNFMDCVSLESVTISEGIEVIPKNLFRNCAIINLTLPETVKNFSCESILGCDRLKFLNIKGVLETEINNNISQLESLETIEIAGCKNFSIYDNPKIKSVKIGHLNPVTTVSGFYFKNCESLSSVEIEHINSGTKEISNYCFHNCSKLERVSIEDAIKICHDAFKNCTALKEINFSNVEIVEMDAFSNCINLESVRLPHIMSLWGSLFSNLKCLKKVDLASDPNYILNHIPEYCFSNCTLLEEINLPDVVQIDRNAFENCISLNDISFPNVEIVDHEAFSGCKGLESVSLPHISKMGDAVFRDCIMLKSIDLASDKNYNDILGYLPPRTFFGCSSLEYIILPVGIKSLERAAFEGCVNLISVTILSPEPPSLYEASKSPFNENVILYVNEKALDLYKNHKVWSRYFGNTKMDVRLFSSAFRKFEFDDFNDKEIKGCTADGMSKLFLSYKTPFEDELEVTFKRKYPIGDDYEILSQQSYNTISAGDIFEYKISDRGIIFTAPEEYVDALPSYDMKIEAKIEHYVEEMDIKLVSTKSLYADIEIWRPGALLVHGLYSNGKNMEPLRKGVRSLYRSDYHVMCADYSDTNTDFFRKNTDEHKVINKWLRVMHDNLLYSHGIVSSKYDLIGHSMGGILSRLYAGKEINRSKVNKIITINTPHSGSQWGNFVQDFITDSRILPSDIFSGDSNLSAMAANGIFDLLKMYILNQNNAISDLATDSYSINKYLNSYENSAINIPVHAITTNVVMSDNELGSFSLSNPFMNWVNVFMFMLYYGYEIEYDGVDFPLVSNEAINKLLNSKENDRVVSLESQKGGLNGSAYTLLSDDGSDLWGFMSNAAHINSSAWSSVISKVRDLLTESVNSECFSKSGFKHNQLQYNWPVSHDNFNRKLNKRKIDDTKEHFFIQECSLIDRTLTIKVDKSESIRYVNVVSYNRDLNLYGRGDNIIKLDIPANFKGDIDFFAWARNDNGLILADTVRVNVSSILTPEKLYFNIPDKFYIYKGDTFSLCPTAEWEDGTIAKVDARLSFNSNIIEIEGNELKAVSVGETTITAKYDGLESSCDIIVLDTPQGYIPIQKNIENVEISLSDDNLVMNVGETKMLKAIVNSSDGVERKLFWYTSNEKVAKVSDDGCIIALNEGRAKITTFCDDGWADCMVYVKDVEIESLTLDIKELKLNKGESYKLKASVLPENIQINSFEWVSSDDSVVSVDNGGNVSALAIGQAKVSVKYKNMMASCDVRVIDTVDVPYPNIESESTVESGTLLYIFNDWVGSIIWYTLDGSNPVTSESRLKYVEPIIISKTTTIKTYAEPDAESSVLGCKSSEVVTFRYYVEESNRNLSAPETDITSGSMVAVGTEVTLTAPDGGDIWYTLDGSNPYISGTAKRYVSPIVITEDVTIRAYADPTEEQKLDGWESSEIVEFVYTIDPTSGVCGLENGELKVTPTANLDGFTVHGAVDATVRVFSSDGKMVMELNNVSETVTVNMNEYISGVYIVSVRENGREATLKFRKR